MHFAPRAPQVPIIDFILENERSNIWASMGTGKSSASIYAFDALRMFGESTRALAIAPKRVALNTWPGEIGKFRESFGHLRVAAAIGNADQRRKVVMSKPDMLCINYENLEWLIDGYGPDWPFDTVFADEATRLQGLRIALIKATENRAAHMRGQGSMRAKALSRVAHKHVRRWINLTGSPAPNGLQCLWGQQFFVDGGQRLGSSFTAFTDRWFKSIPQGDYGHQLVPLPSADRQIKEAIRDCTLTVDIRDYFPIDEPFEHIVPVHLPPKARKAYDDMERDLFAEIEAGGLQAIQAFAAGGKVQKCMQIGNGAVFDSERNWHVVHDAKLEALASVVEETNGEPLLVRYTHVPDRERILRAFPRARILDDKPATQDQWNQGRIPMLLAHAASAGHGLNLQDGGRILVDYCTDYNLEHDEQIVERVGPARQFQSGHPRPVYRYRLIAMDTIEEHAALPRIKSKASVQDSLKAAMKRRA